MWRLARRDGRDGMAIPRAESAEHGKNLTGLLDRLADVAEGIGELLQATGVLGDVHVPLNEVAVLSFQIDGAMEFVVAELIVDLLPDAVCRGFGGAHDVAHVLGDGDVDLADDALINDDPVRIAALIDGWCHGHMGNKIEFAEKGVKEATPFIIVGIGKFKNNRNMRFDIHSLENCDRRGGGIRTGGEGQAGIGRGGRVVVLDVSIEEGIEIHGRGSGRGKVQRRRGWR